MTPSVRHRAIEVHYYYYYYYISTFLTLFKGLHHKMATGTFNLIRCFMNIILVINWTFMSHIVEL